VDAEYNQTSWIHYLVVTLGFLTDPPVFVVVVLTTCGCCRTSGM